MRAPRSFIPLCLCLAALAIVLPGCKTGPAIENREALLSLPYTEFDQTPGSGWRPFYQEQRDCGKAADLIKAYLKRHKELNREQQAVLQFHLGALLAYEGKTPEAVAHLDQAQVHDKSSGLGADWDDMVIATRAFILRDKAHLLATKERLTAARESNEEVDGLIAHFGESYAERQWWAKPCPTVVIPKGASPEIHSAGEKLAKSFGLTMTEAEANPRNCIWLEVRRMGSNSDWNGYIILHYDSGTVISASGNWMLGQAVEQFINSSREFNGIRKVPTGLMTSFRLAKTSAP